MATLTAPPLNLQSSLIGALAGEHPEQALEQAFIQLARGGDLTLLMAMIKALMRVGLAGIGVRLLQSAGGLLAAEPQLASLADRLAKLPSGEMDAAILKRRADENTRALCHTRPHLQPFIEQCHDVMAMHVFVSATGNQYVLRDHPDGKLDFVFPFGDQIVAAQSLKLPEVSLTSSYLMIGVPNPALWARLLDQHAANGYVPPIDIVEPDSEILALWIHLIQRTEALHDERVTVCTGADALEMYRTFLINHRWRWPATHIMTNFRPRWRAPVIAKGFQDSIIAARAEHRHQLKTQLDLRYENRDGRYWSQRFRAASDSGRPLGVVGFTTRYSTVIQHSMRDLASAFERRGCTFDLVKQPNQYCAAVDVPGTLAGADYDLVVAIDHGRFEFGDSIPANIPFVCWIQDYMEQLWDKKAGQSVGDLDLVIGHSPQIMARQYDYPERRFIPSNNLTDAYTYSNDALAESELAPYRCDVSYVSHGAGTPEQLVDEIAIGSPASFRVMLQSVLELVRQRIEATGFATPFDLLDIMLLAEETTGHPPLPPQVRYARVFPQIARIYDRVFRHQSLQWAAEWATARRRCFKIFGRDWDKHPTLKQFACGEVESGFPLRCVYQASRISLQINGYASLHQRLLDGLGAGGFLMSRYNPSDFMRAPFLVIHRDIASSRIPDLASLIELSHSQPDLSDAIKDARELCGIPIATSNHPARRHYCKVIQAGGGIVSLTTDQGLFEALRDLTFVPHRVAADLPGFGATTFRTRASLHEQLDRFVDDPATRTASATTMRDAVLVHDTYDSLVSRILNAFADRALITAHA